ncbi:MAG: hypothetical protein WC545_03175 [Patescibacteria group bacterium]
MFSKIVYPQQLKFFKSTRVLIGAFFIFGLFIFAPTFGGIKIATAATNLDGRILLQVQDKGQAWYVNPLDSRRYYLGRPDDAFNLMRSLGLGATNSDINAFKAGTTPRRLAGRILLQVQDKGQAYYVDPLDLKLYYLGRPADAFNLMRSKGLGITNADLAKIPISQAGVSGSSSSTISAPAASVAPTTAGTITPINFVFKYQNSTYQLTQNLSSAWYDAYKNSSKIYTYSSTAPPTDLREAFYGLFLTIKSGDTSLDDLIVKMRTIEANNN